MLNTETLLMAGVIFLARVCDVSLGTLRHAMIMRDKKLPAFIVSFIESLIWIFAVSRVLGIVHNPFTALAFAAGFATGTYVGIVVDNFLKIGEQVIRVFTNRGDILVPALRSEGYQVTVFEGSGRDGTVALLFIQVNRKNTRKVLALARRIDTACFLVVDDIRQANRAQ